MWRRVSVSNVLSLDRYSEPGLLYDGAVGCKARRFAATSGGDAGETMRRMTKVVLWGALILIPTTAYAQGQPPIRSPQDAGLPSGSRKPGLLRPEPEAIRPL